MIEKINYLVGPNGSGKTRALQKLCAENDGVFIPKQRPTPTVGQFDEEQTVRSIRKFKQISQSSPEQLAMSLLREKSKLRYTVFAILSKKLGRTFSVEIVERSQHFKITSGLDPNHYKEVTVPRYDLQGESSGLRELIVLLTLIHSGLSTKYFIDEPELSLHPEAQRFLKNEMIRLAEEQNCEFWLATHSPIFFSPESIDELKQATFYSDPQLPEGTKPDFDSLSPGQKNHLEKSLLRLDSEKWILVHSKAVIFCEGFRDKTIFKTVLNKVGIDLSRFDYSLVETGGKDDFSTLFLLCQAINKKSFYIGDLDCLIESKLLDKFDDNEIMKEELSGISPSIQDYITNNIKSPLGEIIEKLISIPEADFKARDPDSKFWNNISRIKTRTDNSKSLTLELINIFPEIAKVIVDDVGFTSKIDHLTASTIKAIEILQKVGFFIHKSGTLETYYKSESRSPKDEKKKISLFDDEYESLKTEPKEDIKTRYGELIAFIKSTLTSIYDEKVFIKDEMIKMLSKIQVIILESKPADVVTLEASSKYVSLKISDLFELENIVWTGIHYVLKGKSKTGFTPEFEFEIASNKGILDDEVIKFK